MKKKNFQRLLSGPPETHRIKSGLVALEAGESVGRHSTRDNEEVIIVLEGKAKAGIGSDKPRVVKADSLLYIPPRKKHDITNIGPGKLRYVYITSKV